MRLELVLLIATGKMLIGRTGQKQKRRPGIFLTKYWSSCGVSSSLIVDAWLFSL
jgi:hypothetical protein